METLICYPNQKTDTVYTIPDGVAIIADYAFAGCYNLTSVNLPDGVTSIGDTAFSSSGLTSITIPYGVTSIGEWAFEYCTDLTSASLPDSVMYIGDYAFISCRSLTSINIPEGITSIGECVFSNCESLAEITIPDGVTSIGRNAFAWCESITSINIPESITSISSNAFYGWEKLDTVYYCGTSEQWNSISISSGNSDLTSATMYYHRISEWFDILSATTKTNGVKCRKCSYCDLKETEIIPAIGQENIEASTLPSSTELVLLRKDLFLDGQNNSCYDFNGDSEVDIRDLIRLKNFLAGIYAPLVS